MTGDFSRDTFDPGHGFSQVLLQQGRVILDSDWNEQARIHLHYLRALARDLIGPHGGPGDSFRIECAQEDGDPLNCDFWIGRGHYYVDGILCENHPPAHCVPHRSEARDDHRESPRHAHPHDRETHTRPVSLKYSTQPYYPFAEDEVLEHGKKYFVYLDVWERHVTHIEVPQIREVALGGPDTATRAQVVWQVRVADEDECNLGDDATCDDLMAAIVREPTRCLRARARVAEPSDDPCIIPPEARYRGAENQLYRVEIHEGGQAGAKHGATFKWSRDNGSVTFALRSLQGSLATLDTLGPDDHRGLSTDAWVEIVDDRSVLRGEPGVLAKVDAVDRVAFQVTLAAAEGVSLPDFAEDSTTHALLRRWDQDSAALPVQEGKWMDLEDGVQIFFEPGGTYRTGDYWIIPARAATGDVLWPTETEPDGDTRPRTLPPNGIAHHYAPLGRIALDDDGAVSCTDDCRCTFQPISICLAAVSSPPADVRSARPRAKRPARRR